MQTATVKMPSEPPPAHLPAVEVERPALSRKVTPALRAQHTVRMESDAPPASQVASAQQPTTNGAAVQLPPEMVGKLKELGLTPAQVDAVVALSREVVEKVVWEVVPVLAETIIKEEIARLILQKMASRPKRLPKGFDYQHLSNSIQAAVRVFAAAA